MNTNKKTKQSGFTLIELMIVVAIIGVLSAIAVPAYKDYVKKSEAASALATLKSLITPAELYYQETGSLEAVSSATILSSLGVSSSSNSLGIISVSSNDVLEFKFNGSAVPKDTTITYTRTSGSGWACKVSLEEIATTSCPK